MSQDMIMDIMRNALMTVITTAAPPLLLALIVGLIVSIFQTITSINEQTLVFIPKVVAVFVALIIFGGFMLTNLQDLFMELYTNLPAYTS